ncbi:hypothetical protein BpHYR1_010802 [Brachionus plicatilis]|uniref:Uncharacterized protein n=1 Tax=Brachionus plicatilis TaxID=10195 RepID=A0A3M7P4Y7_BRAPC|nr:hypothetical protein BpHYR1_010802 [Brachionus plicatilis]
MNGAELDEVAWLFLFLLDKYLPNKSNKEEISNFLLLLDGFNPLHIKRYAICKGFKIRPNSPQFRLNWILNKILYCYKSKSKAMFAQAFDTLNSTSWFSQFSRPADKSRDKRPELIKYFNLNFKFIAGFNYKESQHLSFYGFLQRAFKCWISERWLVIKILEFLTYPKL